MRVIIAGGRDRHIAPIDIARELRALGWEPARILCGMASGVDTTAWLWAKMHGVLVEEYPADWGKLGNRAGPARNEAMAQNADALLAFPSIRSAGTRDMIKRARARGLRVHVVEETRP